MVLYTMACMGIQTQELCVYHPRSVHMKIKLPNSTSFIFSRKGLCAHAPAKGEECPEFPKQQSLNCAPHSTVDQCKFDADCTESSNHKCCLIGCQKMCLNPSLIEASISGKSFDVKVN